MRVPALVGALLLVVFSIAVSAFAADVSGEWTVSIDSPQGSAAAAFTLKQDGDKVTGTYKGPRNTAPVEGTLTGDDLKLTASVGRGGQSATLTFTAKVSGDAIDGTLDVGGQASAPFKATRKK